MNQNRVEGGRPDGGRFASSPHAAPDPSVTLTDGTGGRPVDVRDSIGGWAKYSNAAITPNGVGRLSVPTRYVHVDSDTGEGHPVTIPKGAPVLVERVGPTVPSAHGGGFHATVIDPGTGDRFDTVID